VSSRVSVEKRLNIVKFSALVLKSRGESGVREFSKRVGISPATLSRVERGNLPDLETFTKLCAYMNLDPAEILEIKTVDQTPTSPKVINQDAQVPGVHFKAKAQMSPGAAKAVAELILAAQTFITQRG
jgi:transcriptional regulator with XRE-family HTH domain